MIRYQAGWGRPCFTDEKNCRNWLYNMQSEFSDRVTTAVCKRGGLK